MKITEAFLYFVWQNQLFDQSQLNIYGEPLKIIDPGKRNPYSGPDFSFSKIKIGETIWAGNIEIHVKSSDWYKHQHQEDDAFKNVILHVVYEDDLQNDKSLPNALSLKSLIYSSVINNYTAITSNKDWLPCKPLFKNRDEIKTNIWLEGVCIKRLERKVEEIFKIYNALNNDIEQTFFVLLGKAIGQKANAEAFEFLTTQTPLYLLLKYADKPEIVEALLLGQAGFLAEEKDFYQKQLKNDFEFFAIKHQLKAMALSIWKRGGVRPNNQPTVRIAQFARLVIKLFPFAEKLEKLELNDLIKTLRVGTSTYWNNHFVFGKESQTRKKIIGNTTVESILINAIIPFLFFVGEKNQNFQLKEKALNFLEKLKPENNSIIKKWQLNGVVAKNALFSQALIEQHNNYCKKLECLNCGIGNQVIKRKQEDF